MFRTGRNTTEQLDRQETKIGYFVRISYDGTNYGGWQRQANNDTTVQQTIEHVLAETFSQRISIAGCGRTDAGVHANQFYFFLPLDVELPQNFLFFMNKKLPADIAFHEIINVAEKAHVCLDAVSRTYDYFFHDFPDAILARTSSLWNLRNFDEEKVTGLLSQLVGRRDFREFCLTPARQNSTIVNLLSASLFIDPKSSRYRIQFTANRFLRGMIRVLVNDLVLVGSGEILPSSMESLLAGETRNEKVNLAPPQGLFLTAVNYPYMECESGLPVSGQCDWKLL